MKYTPLSLYTHNLTFQMMIKGFIRVIYIYSKCGNEFGSTNPSIIKFIEVDILDKVDKPLVHITQRV